MYSLQTMVASVSHRFSRVLTVGFTAACKDAGVECFGQLPPQCCIQHAVHMS